MNVQMIINFIAASNVHRYVVDPPPAYDLIIPLSGYKWIFSRRIAEVHPTYEMCALDLWYPVMEIVVTVLLDVESVP